MPRYVALLRAINLGARRKFPAADVVRVTESVGHTEVRTHLNTGNVGFSTSMRSPARIETALEAAYAADRGFEVPTVVLTTAELARIVADVEELAEGHAGRAFVSVLKAEPDVDAVAALEARSTDAERAIVRGRAVHLLIGESYHTATLSNALVEKHLGVATNRAAGVLRTLHERWG